MWRRRWHDVPRGIQVAVAVQALVLTYGGVVHLSDLVTAGWPPYRWAPVWLAVYFTSLTIADPLAALLLASRRACGLYLAVLILATDAGANWYATYGLSRDPVAARVAQAVISGLALASLLIAHRAGPWMRRRSPSEQEPAI